jgi:transcriptional regulator with XRE-family HTH domain
MAVNSGDFSKMVKDVRSQLGLSQEELAHELGVSFATINRWENGKTSASQLARAQFRMFCDQKVAQGLLSMGKEEI